ncbi:MAG: hypothetical protein NTV01_12065 [Bacteroidia bacterium]|nr:hypothetical protein [Bacteroidia bacterium]
MYHDGVDGTTVNGFQPSLLTYTVVLPSGTSIIPTITAEDGITFRTYEITIRYPMSGINDINDQLNLRIICGSMVSYHTLIID